MYGHTATRPFDHYHDYKVLKKGIAFCRHETLYRILIDEYRYNDNIVYWYTGLVFTV